MGQSYSPKIVTNGLVLYLDAANIKSYPGSGASWLDLSGLGRNATLFNNAVYNSEKGGCIDFNTTNDSYATIPNDTQISDEVFGSSTNFTLSTWFVIDEYLNYSCFIQKATSGSYSNSTAGLWSQTTNELRFVIGSNVDSNPAGSTFSLRYLNATPGAWYNMVGVGDGTNAKLYINGQFITQQPFSNITVTRTTNTAVITIGRRAMNSVPECDGRIAIVSAYNRGLSDQDVLQNFNALRTRFGI